ncbi:hypothetical protein GRF59_14870 [Paenibacillus sp. HJL G12]|uniref:Uncharacterized protein n=1 Tax=Paenibacillus dendrobii TaxID=2691084 RepID=A0A7X3LH92_9BACL|nr:hypothetical protein [Paenibacillus dendrobii]MWV44902.1 hypothetical protein [Paenibacillus dendrobii]
MTYTLNSGIKGTVPLSNNQISRWIECFKINIRFVTSIGNEFFGLNPSLVADFKVHNEKSGQQNQKETSKKLEHLETLSEAYKSNEIAIKVDCKCGTTYTTTSQHYVTKWYCSKCNEIVFLDKNKGKVPTDKGEALYLTNKYFIDRKILNNNNLK